MDTDEKRLRKVSIGIGMMLASIVVLFLLIVSFLVSPLTASIGSAAFKKAVFMIQLRFALPILLTSTLLGVAGPCLCLAAPRDVRGTGYLLVSVLLNAFILLVSALGMLVTLPDWLSGIAFFLTFVSNLFFVLFVRRLANFLERQDILKLARGTLALASMAAVLAAFSLAIIKLKFDLGPIALVVGVVLPAVILIVAVLAFLRYLWMLEYARRAALARIQSK